MKPRKHPAENRSVPQTSFSGKSHGSARLALTLCLAIAAVACGVALWRMTRRPEQPGVVEELFEELVPIPGRNFLLARTEVPQALWEAVMGADTNRVVEADLPVSGVSWNDCQMFLERLNSLPAVNKSGITFRLPTEEEWVFACRAGARGQFGMLADGTEISEDNIGEVAWIDDNSEKRAHPVGSKEPNAFGLYDMHGNVWEWCQDEFGKVSSWAQDHEHDRIYHGGSWLSQAWLCMPLARRWTSPDAKEDFIGFRLCADKR